MCVLSFRVTLITEAIDSVYLLQLSKYLYKLKFLTHEDPPFMTRSWQGLIFPMQHNLAEF